MRVRNKVRPSKAQVARSNRAGQAKFHIGSYRSRLIDCGLLTQSYVSFSSVGVALSQRGGSWPTGRSVYLSDKPTNLGEQINTPLSFFLQA